eukprot:1555488-Pleurochrysis_carterae.AAC.3
MFWTKGGATFKPQKKVAPGTRRFELHKQAAATLGAGNLEEAVRLPAGEDLNDWLAVNVTDFYNEISLLYGVLMDTCTPISCPTMSAGPKFEYKWADGVRIKKPVRCSGAPTYCGTRQTVSRMCAFSLYRVPTVVLPFFDSSSSCSHFGATQHQSTLTT